ERPEHRPGGQPFRRLSTPDGAAVRKRMAAGCGLVGEIGKQSDPPAVLKPPMRTQNTAWLKLGATKGNTRQSRDDILLADGKQCFDQPMPIASFVLPLVPIELCRLEGRYGERIRHIIAVGLISFSELASPPLANRLRELAIEIAEERERRACAPFLAHEQ